MPAADLAIRCTRSAPFLIPTTRQPAHDGHNEGARFRMRTLRFAPALILLLAACVALKGPANLEGVRLFVEEYTRGYLEISTRASEASWQALVDVTPAHDEERVRANRALAEFTGAAPTIASARASLKLLQSAAAGEASPGSPSRLDETTLLRRQVERILLGAAEAPGTIPAVVKARVEAESRQASIQDSFQYELDGKKVNANDLDDLLQSSTDLKARQAAWVASKAIGKPLRAGLVELQKLRNAGAREMGYSSFHALQVADYEMTVPEMRQLLEGFLADTRPLYEQLHTWTKHELARRYGVPPPDGPLPAHWINNRWSQNWTGVVASANLDDQFKNKTPEWIVKQAEAFYVSLGFPALPGSFWTKSDLYPVPAGSGRKKNSHASAWHIDLQSDVRSCMSLQPNDRWFGTAHHELGHIYYYLSYSRPEVPPLLRAGANRAFHEGIGELISIASRQLPYLQQLGLLPAGAGADQVPFLLDEALSETVPFIAWSAGVMARWEEELYEKDLPVESWNRRWWELVLEHQGIVPPVEREPDACDPATKTHINDDPAQYYDYAIATVLKYQLHDHIARKILGADPRACNYFGNREVGAFLASVLRQGATRPWRAVLEEATGEPLSTRALLEYFKPLQSWLEKENAGRKIGWR